MTMTQRQWQEVFTIVRREQKGLLKEMWDKDHYDELSKILDNLYPYAYGAKDEGPDAWSFE